MRSDEPYIGLRPFHRAERDRFFGRDLEAGAVSDLWRTHRVTLLHGSSGVGKTSLLRAGVVPRCAQDTHVLPIARVTVEAPLPARHPDTYNPYSVSLLTAWSPGATPPAVGDSTVTQFLLGRFGTAPQTRPVLVAIDQFEEFVNDLPHRRPFQKAFVQQLGHALSEIPGLRLLLAVREDFLGAVEGLEAALGQPVDVEFAVSPLDRRSALDAVVGPLRASWRSFAPGAAQRLVDILIADRAAEHREIGTVPPAAVEPARLQVVCRELWDALPTSVTTINAGHVDLHVNIDRPLSDVYRQKVAEVAAQEGVAEHDLWQWLDEAFVTNLDTRGSVYEGVSTTGWMPNSVPHALDKRDVLQSEVRARSRRFELAHDRLIEPIRLNAEFWLAAQGSRAFPGTVRYLLHAEFALAAGRPDLAARHAREVLRTEGVSSDRRASAEAEALLGKLVLDEGDATTAERHFRSAAELFGSLPDTAAVGRVLADIGVLRLKEGNHAEAVNEFAAALALAPDDHDIKVDFARAYWATGDGPTAVAALNSVLNISLSHVEALVLRGLVLITRGEIRAGRSDLLLAIQLDPDVGGRVDVAEALRVTSEPPPDDRADSPED